MPWIVSTAARVLVSSRDYAEHSALVTLPGVIARTEVHPYGVDLERFVPGTDHALRASLALDPESPVILFVGGLDRAHDFKGLSVLLAALASLDDLRWDAVIAGDGPGRRNYQALAARHGLSANVRFVGDVADADLPRYYRIADVHVLPSTSRSEAFGLVTLEAAASGIPSIVSDLPGVRTTVIDHQTGLHVPPGDAGALAVALKHLLCSAATRRTFGQASRARAERSYAWPPLIDRLCETYADVAPRS